MWPIKEQITKMIQQQHKIINAVLLYFLFQLIMYVLKYISYHMYVIEFYIPKMTDLQLLEHSFGLNLQKQDSPYRLHAIPKPALSMQIW